MSLKGLEDALAKARDNLASGLVTSEAAVQAAVIRPILCELGWDIADPQQWQVEYRVDGGRVDEALLGSLGKPLVFVEAKKPGNLNLKAEDQLFGYAANNGVPILVLTDGDAWDMYLSMAAGEPTDRRFAHLTLTESVDLGRTSEDLQDFMGRDAVLSQRAESAARARLKRIKDRAIGNSGLASAWAELLLEPDDMLCDLLIERVEQRTGTRPAPRDTERFLRSQLHGPNSGTRADATPNGPRVADGEGSTQRQAAAPSEHPSERAKLTGFEFRGKRYIARNAAAVIALLADTLADVDPVFLERWASSGAGRILPRAIQAGHPLLADPKRRNWYARLPERSDWYVFTAVNQGQKLVRMQDMAVVAGLIPDSEVRPILD